MKKSIFCVSLIIFSGLAIAQQGFFIQMSVLTDLERYGEGSHAIFGAEFRDDNSNYQENRCTLHIYDKDTTDTTSENGYIQYRSGDIIPQNGKIPDGDNKEFEDGNIPGGFLNGERTAKDAYNTLRESGFHGEVSEGDEIYVHTESDLIGDGFELTGEVVCGTEDENGEDPEWRMCKDDNEGSNYYSENNRYECSNNEWNIANNNENDYSTGRSSECGPNEYYNPGFGRCLEGSTSDTGDSESSNYDAGGTASGPSECSPDEYYDAGFNRCLEKSTSDTSNSESNSNIEEETARGPSECGPNEYYDGGFNRCLEKTESETDDSDSSNEETNNQDRDNEETTEDSNSEVIEVDLTKGEWAALGSVDPEFITGENVSNLNERSMDFQTSVVAVREAVRENGWIAESNERFEVLIDLSERSRDSNADGPSNSGQGMQAADKNFLVTEDTASPYDSDGCYSNRKFEPVEYGTLDNDFGAASFEGPDWDPDEFKCPKWMEGGYYEGTTYNLDWDKLGNIRSGSDTGKESNTGEGTTDKEVTEVVESENSNSVSWTSYCGTQFESSEIDDEDGIDKDEATICMETCYGSDTEKMAPNSDISCGELVEDFCTPYYEYNSNTNKCEES